MFARSSLNEPFPLVECLLFWGLLGRAHNQLHSEGVEDVFPQYGNLSSAAFCTVQGSGDFLGRPVQRAGEVGSRHSLLSELGIDRRPNRFIHLSDSNSASVYARIPLASIRDIR